MAELKIPEKEKARELYGSCRHCGASGKLEVLLNNKIEPEVCPSCEAPYISIVGTDLYPGQHLSPTSSSPRDNGWKGVPNQKWDRRVITY